MNKKISSSDLHTNTQYLNELPQHRLYITEFRINPCDCSNTFCIHLHPHQHARRFPLILPDGTWNYLPRPCNNSEPCKMGKKCKFAHNREECSYHPLVYKITNCAHDSLELGKCSKWGYDCSFAHLEADRRVKGTQQCGFSQVNYKTLQCNSRKCRGSDCLFFHDSLERRRNQIEFAYSSVPCKFVCKGKSFIAPENCPLGDMCSLAHTKNEVFFHTDNYLKKQCMSEPCYKLLCPFLHKGVTERTEAKIEDVENEEKEEIDENRNTVFDNEEKEEERESRNPVVEEKIQEKTEIPYKIRCKACNTKQMKWRLECGAVVCSKCLSKKCYNCPSVHATRS